MCLLECQPAAANLHAWLLDNNDDLGASAVSQTLTCAVGAVARI